MCLTSCSGAPFGIIIWSAAVPPVEFRGRAALRFLGKLSGGVEPAISRHHYFLLLKADGGAAAAAAALDITHMLMLMAAQRLQVGPATKGPHLLSKGYCSCCAKLVKKREGERERGLQRDNVYQKRRRTPSFYIAITAAY